MKAPTISVLMPAYNAESFIRSAVASVLSQTTDDFELLIINDASTDGTGQAICEFSDDRIRLLHNSTNLGIVGTLNRGIREARGEYIARLDADDLSYPTRFEEELNVLQRDGSVGLVASWSKIIDERNRVQGFGRWHLSSEAIYYALHFRQCLTHSSVMFRTSLVRELGGYSQVRAEDLDLWHRISKISRIVQVPKVLVQWRQHSGSITGRERPLLEHNAFELASEFIREAAGEAWSGDTIRAMCDCGNVRDLRLEDCKLFLRRLGQVQDSILRTAPAVYNRPRLVKYAEVEMAKYAHLLPGFRASGHTTSAVLKILGFMYCLRSYYRVPIISRLVPRTHF